MGKTNQQTSKKVAKPKERTIKDALKEEAVLEMMSKVKTDRDLKKIITSFQISNAINKELEEGINDIIETVVPRVAVPTFFSIWSAKIGPKLIPLIKNSKGLLAVSEEDLNACKDAVKDYKARNTKATEEAPKSSKETKQSKAK